MLYPGRTVYFDWICMTLGKNGTPVVIKTIFQSWLNVWLGLHPQYIYRKLCIHKWAMFGTKCSKVSQLQTAGLDRPKTAFAILEWVWDHRTLLPWLERPRTIKLTRLSLVVLNEGAHYVRGRNRNRGQTSLNYLVEGVYTIHEDVLEHT